MVCSVFSGRASALLGGLLIVGGAGALVAAYFTLHHVASHIDRFLRSVFGRQPPGRSFTGCFINGGRFSGAARRRRHRHEVLPDAHFDFVFAVAGEEFGLFVCLIIVGLFAFIVLRGFARALQETDLFILLATAGLLVQFGLQAVINMGSTYGLCQPRE